MAKLEAGGRFPDFQFHTASGLDGNALETIKKAQRTVFWVLRYVGCTSCRYDIHLIKERYGEFLALGAQVLVVLQSQPDMVNADLKGDEVPYEIITDPEQEIYRRFSIGAAASTEALRPRDPAGIEKWEAKRALAKESGFVHGNYEGNENQLPAMFIVDAQGNVEYVHYAANIADMPGIDEVLEKCGAPVGGKRPGREELTALARDWGIRAVGFLPALRWIASEDTPVGTAPLEVWPPVKSIVVLGIPEFPVTALDAAKEFGGWDVRNGLLDTAAYRLSLYLNRRGYPSVNIPTDSGGEQSVDRPTTAIFSHRRAAGFAGLIPPQNDGSSPWRFASVFTRAELEG
jgi:peroxiredoxin